jgi:hypothetical protein
MPPSQSVGLGTLHETPQERRFYVWLALLFLLLTAVLSTCLSYQRLMDNDEALSYYGDRAATVADVVRIQLHSPISLDPPTYHILSHLSMDLFGRNEMAMRVPALVGFLVFQWCLFVFVRRLAGSRAALVALLLPIASTMFFYTAVGRPYGFLLGLYAMSLVCWQTAARRQEAGEPRLFSLVAIAAVLWLAITSHFFGVLILVPLCLAELARTVQRRRFDYGMLAAIFVGMLSIPTILPFRKAVLVYREHYYIGGVTAGVIREAYRSIFFRFENWPMLYKRALALSLAIGLLVLAVGSWRRFRKRERDEPAYEWGALLAIALLPVFGYLLGRFVTHTMEVRYVMAWQFAVAACFGLSMERLLQRKLVLWGTVTAILIAGGALIRWEIGIYRTDRFYKLESLRISPAVSQAILSDPSRRIYIQSLENFFVDEHYEADPKIRERFSFVYGQDQEIGWLEHDTNFITARSLEHFTDLHVTPYDKFLAEPAPLLILYGVGWEWIDRDLKVKGRGLVSHGPLMRGELFEVQPAGADAADRTP